MKHLLKLSDLTKDEILEILDLADELKKLQRDGVPHKRLEGQVLAMIFTKNSTRTRVSFETGIFQLGGHGIFMSSQASQLSRGEPMEDTARTIGRYCDGIMIRTYAQRDVEILAEYSGIPVINGLTDLCHPCQVLADLQTIREYKGGLEGRKLAFNGDTNNMANSLIAGGLICGMDVAVASPEGYELLPEVLDFAAKFPGHFTFTHDSKEAVADADVVYTDVWASMGQEGEIDERRKAFETFPQVNEELLKFAKPDVILEHCLPAHKGEEISAESFEKHAKEIFDEAENRLHAQKAVMCMIMT